MNVHIVVLFADACPYGHQMAVFVSLSGLFTVAEQ